eukprot:Tbor_TRINITY_DN5882_c0_g1::TRINITY_DN5882_c0_g1_i1::g.7265::m.7265
MNSRSLSPLYPVCYKQGPKPHTRHGRVREQRGLGMITMEDGRVKSKIIDYRPITSILTDIDDINLRGIQTHFTKTNSVSSSYECMIHTPRESAISRSEWVATSSNSGKRRHTLKESHTSYKRKDHFPRLKSYRCHTAPCCSIRHAMLVTRANNNNRTHRYNLKAHTVVTETLGKNTNNPNRWYLYNKALDSMVSNVNNDVDILIAQPIGQYAKEAKDSLEVHISKDHPTNILPHTTQETAKEQDDVTMLKRQVAELEESLNKTIQSSQGMEMTLVEEKRRITEYVIQMESKDAEIALWRAKYNAEKDVCAELRRKLQSCRIGDVACSYLQPPNQIQDSLAPQLLQHCSNNSIILSRCEDGVIASAEVTTHHSRNTSCVSSCGVSGSNIDSVGTNTTSAVGIQPKGDLCDHPIITPKSTFAQTNIQWVEGYLMVDGGVYIERPDKENSCNNSSAADQRNEGQQVPSHQSSDVILKRDFIHSQCELTIQALTDALKGNMQCNLSKDSQVEVISIAEQFREDLFQFLTNTTSSIFIDRVRSTNISACRSLMAHTPRYDIGDMILRLLRRITSVINNDDSNNSKKNSCNVIPLQTSGIDINKDLQYYKLTICKLKRELDYVWGYAIDEGIVEVERINRVAWVATEGRERDMMIRWMKSTAPTEYPSGYPSIDVRTEYLK